MIGISGKQNLSVWNILVSPFFHQQNIVRQPIKLYDISDFSATKKEKV